MRCVTVLQPVVEPMIAGVKGIENRSNRVTVSTGGLLLGLHAGKKWWSPTGPMARVSEEGFDVVRDRWPSGSMISPPRFEDAERLVTGAIVGVIRVVACVPVDEIRGRDPWALGPWCWILDRVWRLAEPIPAVGALGLWDPGEDASRALYRLVLSEIGTPIDARQRDASTGTGGDASPPGRPDTSGLESADDYQVRSFSFTCDRCGTTSITAGPCTRKIPVGRQRGGSRRCGGTVR